MRVDRFINGRCFLNGDAHARRPLHKMDRFFLSGDAHARRPLHKMDGVLLSGDAHARRPLHKWTVFFKRRRACASTAS